jgi:cobalamin biosynthesis Co2+ chelatase CbiK
MPQTVFGGLAYKYGHTRYNEWQDDDKEIVVSSAIKDIEDEFSEELEFLDDKTSAEILKRLKDLEIIYPNSPALKKFKKKYLNSNNKSVQTAKEKAKVKKK